MRALAGVVLATACAPEARTGPCEGGIDLPAGAGTGSNVVVVLLDDLGIERFGDFADATAPVPLPAFEHLSDVGLRFEAAYADATCSPTRASLLTGRRPGRHGVGRFLEGRHSEQLGLDHSEITIPEMLRDSPLGPWSTAMVGKWHLDPFRSPGAVTAPNDQGFDSFRGILGNPDTSLTLAPGAGDYFRWEYAVDGGFRTSDEYLTTAQTNDALAALDTLREPFFLYVAYSATHAPFHAPPEALRSTPLPPEPSLQQLQRAMLEALDHELQRLLDSVDLDDTLLLVMADNGTPQEVMAPGLPRGAGSKGDVRELGVHVPLWAAGAGVGLPGDSNDDLVHAVDVFATVADVAGVDLRGRARELDGRSLLPLLAGEQVPWRPCLVSEAFPDNGAPHREDDLAVRDAVHLAVDGAHRPPQLRSLALDRRGEPSLLPESPGTEASLERLLSILREHRRSVR